MIDSFAVQIVHKDLIAIAFRPIAAQVDHRAAMSMPSTDHVFGFGTDFRRERRLHRYSADVGDRIDPSVRKRLDSRFRQGS